MRNNFSYKTFSPDEERLNVFTHAAGILLSIFALVLLMQKALVLSWDIFFCFVVYGLSLMFTFFCSTLVHSTLSAYHRSLYNLIDFISIDILIASTYAPISLFQIKNDNGFFLFLINSILAAVNIILKIFFQDSVKTWSILIFALMVLSGLLFVNDLPPLNLTFFVAGMLCFGLGFLFYHLTWVKHHHAIFHVLVLIGCLSLFMEIFLFEY